MVRELLRDIGVWLVMLHRHFRYFKGGVGRRGGWKVCMVLLEEEDRRIAG